MGFFRLIKINKKYISLKNKNIKMIDDFLLNQPRAFIIQKPDKQKLNLLRQH